MDNLTPNNEFANLTEGFGKNVNELKSAFNGFSSNNNFLNASKEFLQSNSLIAKLAFLFLVIILFVIVLRLGSSLISWLLSPDSNPKLVDGMKDASKLAIVTQDPKLKGSKTILRSNNEQEGLEFTYSVWLYINNLTEGQGRYKHIFHKGNDNIQTGGTNNGMNLPNNGPGMYLDKDTNSLVIVMNTFNNVIEKVNIDNIPLNKWINVLIRVEGAKMDVYINGTITLRHEFSSVPKQNYGDIYVNLNGGFNGFLSDLWYHDYGLNIKQIMNIVQTGPNLEMKESMGSQYAPPYFSLRWYLDR